MTWFQCLMIMGSIWWCSGDASKNNILRFFGLVYFLMAIVAGVSSK